MTDDEVAAHHESGHAVAAVMRGGTFSNITIEPEGNRFGYIETQVKSYHAAFVAYAGPWAEARAEWTKPLDGEDDDGSTFDDYLARAFGRNAGGDLREYLRCSLADAAVYGDVNTWLTFASERRWGSELEAKWPVIRQVAELLTSGADLTAEMVLALLRWTDNRRSAVEDR